jgi:hypothetical protein
MAKIELGDALDGIGGCRLVRKSVLRNHRDKFHADVSQHPDVAHEIHIPHLHMLAHVQVTAVRCAVEGFGEYARIANEMPKHAGNRVSARDLGSDNVCLLGVV